MPGAGPPSVHGFSACMGSGNRKQPTISVPPEMLMIGQPPAAHPFEKPEPRFLVPWLARGAQHAQRRHRR